jgi:ribosome-associated translation inhibitor RaiA
MSSATRSQNVSEKIRTEMSNKLNFEETYFKKSPSEFHTHLNKYYQWKVDRNYDLIYL